MPYLASFNIKVSSFLGEDDLRTEQIVGVGKGVLLTWNYDPNATCDYVVKWCNSSQAEPCLMDWKKVPANSTETVVESGECFSEPPDECLKRATCRVTSLSEVAVLPDPGARC